MRLSPIYNSRIKWVMVYHTSYDSEEVEMLNGDLFFETEKGAWDWFHANHRIHNYIQPEAVIVSLGKLVLNRQE